MKDYLYGEVDVSGLTGLINDPLIARSDDISLSSIPPRFLGVPEIDSRLKHGIGTMHLSRILCQQETLKEHATLFEIASVMHDAGAPPFSHTSERLLEEIMKMNHEEFAFQMFKGTSVDDFIKSKGYELREVCDFIEGKNPASRALSGTIDLDNIDNVLRYGLQMGVFEKPAYDAEKLVSALAFNGSNYLFRKGAKDIVNSWIDARKKMYSFVHDINSHLSTAAMLHKVLTLMHSEHGITKEFFTFTETQAFKFIEENAGKEASSIYKDLQAQVKYPLVYNAELSGKVSIDYIIKQQEIIAEELKIPYERLCCVQVDDRSKQIDIPFEDSSYPPLINGANAHSLLFYAPSNKQ